MSKKKAGSFKDGIQTFGRSLLLPIALLAPIGMVMGICSALGQSYMIEKFPILDAAVLKLIISGAKDITSIIFNNIPILFAMGVAQGMAKKEKGIAVFASVVGYLTLNTVMNVFLKNTSTLADADTMAQVGQGMVLGVQTLKTEALGGLISGGESGNGNSDYSVGGGGSSPDSGVFRAAGERAGRGKCFRFCSFCEA